MTESGRRRRSFPDEFKLEAVAAVRGGRTVGQVAAELGLPDRLVRAWLRWAETRPSGGTGASLPTSPSTPAVTRRRIGPSPADHAAEIEQLRRENERLRMECDILKRAALIFGRATDRR
jgi:transposase